MRQPLLELVKVSKIYGIGQAAMSALRGISLAIYSGEFVALMGPSGSGKSTCLNILGCLDVPSSGHYFFAGYEVGRLSRNGRARLRRQYLGFIFQNFNLLPRATALENVELPLVYRGVPATQRRALAKDALAKVGLSGWEQHTPAELSGGQQQRVAIARAIVTHPKVILADEPTGNLDSARSLEIMELLRAFNRNLNVTVVMVTHEAEMAQFAHRILRFRDGQLEGEVKNPCFGTL